MAIRQKTTVTHRATASWPTPARTEIPIRDLVAIVAARTNLKVNWTKAET